MKNVIVILKKNLSEAKKNLAVCEKLLPNCYVMSVRKIYKSKIKKEAKLIKSLERAIQILELNRT